MQKLHSIAALCGEGLRPELRELFERLAIDPHSGLHIRHDGMVQASENGAMKYNRAMLQMTLQSLPRRRNRRPSHRRSHDSLLEAQKSNAVHRIIFSACSKLMSSGPD